MAHVLCSNCVHLVGSDECISPVPELLRANKAPSSTEADAIKKFLVDVDSELHYLESILPKLTARRDHLKSVADSHRPLLSPALRIFPELLSEIFSWSPGAPTQDRSVNLPDNFDPRHGPLLLTQICRSWRKTAIATPKLWSTIRFVLGTRDKSKLIDMWLERSRDFDLTIAILDRSRSDHEAVRVRDLAFNAKTIHHLASRAHRWKSVFLQLPPYASYKVYWHALSGAKGNIGRLQQLSVHITRGQWQVAMPNIFTGGPQLTSLTLNHLISVDTFPIAGSRITEFRYENSARSGDASAYVPISECIKALRRFPNLERCHLDCSLHSNTDIANITMAKLERLTIRSLERLSLTLNPGELWQALHLPNLKILNDVGRSHIPLPDVSHSCSSVRFSSTTRARRGPPKSTQCQAPFVDAGKRPVPGPLLLYNQTYYFSITAGGYVAQVEDDTLYGACGR
ncbi:hypothetical protein EST38_g13213 [Candolleomyces aberdarensis]|uniref:F-box domain-containing protein n=1 Tax=Candolleomyces aberdarensis TaxID=2316362 RepID=A0A4Q2D1L5_9AGAR|nr:hypothetical protein EST38_g13213 [Candolleomyces aberdarensis]